MTETRDLTEHFGAYEKTEMRQILKAGIIDRLDESAKARTSHFADERPDKGKASRMFLNNFMEIQELKVSTIG